MKPILASVDCTGEGSLVLWLHGRWSVHEINDIEHMLGHISIKNLRRIVLDGRDLETIDISAAWTLVEFARAAGSAQVETVQRNFKPAQIKIFDIITRLSHHDTGARKLPDPVRTFFVHTGKVAVLTFEGFCDLVGFFGKLCVTVLLTLRHPARLRVRSALYHVNAVGITAIPIVSVMAFLISVVLAYQGALQLDKFGANIYTVNLVGISLLREMGVIITSIIVAGRSGSAFAAQIGVMQVNQEIDAMRTFGLDPFELLVLPRILGILIALPALTFIADVVGLVGTMFICGAQLDIGHAQFMSRLHEAVNAQTFFIGLVKAPVFAMLIGMTGCMQGLKVRGSAEEVGERTTSAVVQSIFLVVLADAAFSVWFTWLGI
jgi:phospholipid/cholesterol/gamma-HCH transport system permease protein